MYDPLLYPGSSRSDVLESVIQGFVSEVGHRPDLRQQMHLAERLDAELGDATPAVIAWCLTREMVREHKKSL